MGVAVTLLSAVIGLLWHSFRIDNIMNNLNKKIHVWLEFYMLGLIVHIGMLLCTLALPREYIVVILRQIFAPVLLLYPIGFLFLCMVIFTGFKNRQTNLALEDSKKRYKELYYEHQNKRVLLLSLINSIPDLIFYKDSDGIYMGCNKAFEEFTGREEKDKVILETMKTLYYDSEGNILGLIGVSRDITKSKQKEEEILYLNYHDVLTGLYNRAFFDEELKRLDTERQLPLSVIIGDINGLKLINDALGHAEGDKLLVAMSKILKNCCRAEDIIARTGGDEFGILLPKTDTGTTIYPS